MLLRVVDTLTLGPVRRSRRVDRQLRALQDAGITAQALGADPVAVWEHALRERPIGVLRARRVRALGAARPRARLHPSGAATVADPWGTTGDVGSGCPAQRPQSRGERLVAVAALVLVGALTVVVATGLPGRWAHADPRSAERSGPPAGVGEQPQRVLAAVPGPVGTGGYAIARRQASGTAVTWDPCRVVHYVVAGTAPAGGDRALADAIRDVSAASGLSFVRDGVTDERPGDDRAAFQPDRYGQRWAPLLIAWTSPGEVAGLAGQVDGLGGAYAVPDATGHLTYVTGTVSLDAPQLAGEARDGQAWTLRTAALHELSHALGLAHVDDPTQVMDATSSVRDLAAGDRRGLAALGRGACAPGV